MRNPKLIAALVVALSVGLALLTNALAPTLPTVALLLASCWALGVVGVNWYLSERERSREEAHAADLYQRLCEEVDQASQRRQANRMLKLELKERLEQLDAWSRDNEELGGELSGLKLEQIKVEGWEAQNRIDIVEKDEQIKGLQEHRDRYVARLIELENDNARLRGDLAERAEVVRLVLSLVSGDKLQELGACEGIQAESHDLRELLTDVSEDLATVSQELDRANEDRKAVTRCVLEFGRMLHSYGNSPKRADQLLGLYRMTFGPWHSPTAYVTAGRTFGPLTVTVED